VALNTHAEVKEIVELYPYFSHFVYGILQGELNLYKIVRIFITLSLHITHAARNSVVRNISPKNLPFSHLLWCHRAGIQ
jgi:hypothetical protein